MATTKNKGIHGHIQYFVIITSSRVLMIVAFGIVVYLLYIPAGWTLDGPLFSQVPLQNHEFFRRPKTKFKMVCMFNYSTWFYFTTIVLLFRFLKIWLQKLLKSLLLSLFSLFSGAHIRTPLCRSLVLLRHWNQRFPYSHCRKWLFSHILQCSKFNNTVSHHRHGKIKLNEGTQLHGISISDRSQQELWS